MRKRQHPASPAALFTSKRIVVALCAAIAMVIGAMSVGAYSPIKPDSTPDFAYPAANQITVVPADKKYSWTQLTSVDAKPQKPVVVITGTEPTATISIVQPLVTLDISVTETILGETSPVTITTTPPLLGSEASQTMPSSTPSDEPPAEAPLQGDGAATEKAADPESQETTTQTAVEQ